jgi:hypothetical protein
MKKIEIYSVAIVLSLTTVPMHAMFKLLMHSHRKQPVNILHNKRLFGIKVATMPQTAKGVLGDFRLDKKYNVRELLASYIAADKKIDLQCAQWASWQDTQKAYGYFLGHNSAINIKKSLNDNVIDTRYAIRSLYFTQKVAWTFEDLLKYNQEFTHLYSNDAEQWVWCDRTIQSKECNQLLHDITIEQESVATLVDFLSQKPVGESLVSQNKRMSLRDIGSEVSSANAWPTCIFDAEEKKEINHPIKTAENPQTRESDILGSFVNSDFNLYKITDYLRNYLARDLKIEKEYVDTQAKIKDIKKAFQIFLHHNHPVIIYEMLKQQRIEKVHAEAILEFTCHVIFALERYLNKDHLLEDETDVFMLYWTIKRMRDQCGFHLTKLLCKS